MFPELSTERFFLRRILPDDRPFIFEGLSNPEVIPYYGVSYDTLEATGAQIEFYDRIWRERTGCWWKIVERESDFPVGACGMNGFQPEHEKAEIGYWLLPAYWKKGIMPEVVPVMIRHLFSAWKLHRLEAVIENGNDASCRLTEKLGFRYEGMLREAEIKMGRRISLHYYGLLRTDLQ